MYICVSLLSEDILWYIVDTLAMKLLFNGGLGMPFFVNNELFLSIVLES